MKYGICGLHIEHIVIYTIFVTSATDLVEESPLYAVVCIGFMVPAEKFIRKMFGFDKATTTNPIGAAAGGAMVMNAINKIGNTKVKEEAKQENKPVRTSGMGGGNLWNGPQSGNRRCPNCSSRKRPERHKEEAEVLRQHHKVEIQHHNSLQQIMHLMQTIKMVTQH